MMEFSEIIQLEGKLPCQKVIIFTVLKQICEIRSIGLEERVFEEVIFLWNKSGTWTLTQSGRSAVPIPGQIGR